jgi:two-component system OmpR family sensor kinase
MSLTRRFSALFLGVLCLVLVGFSTAIYFSAQVYLDRQIRERLEAALAVLAAAAEIHPDGVEWEPQERVLPLGQEIGPDRLRWLVFDDRGRRVDHSRNWTEAELSAQWAHQPENALATDRFVDHQRTTWLVSHRQVLPGVPPGLGSRAAEHQVAPAEASAGEVLHRHLVLIVCVPIFPSQAALTNLAAFLVAVSLGAWLLAAMLCRKLSRSALAPLTRMVASARGLDALDPGWHLEEPGTRDELDELGRAFNDLLARLQMAYHRQRAFSSDASHQLRTPITVLTGQLEVALRQDRAPEEYRRVLRAALARGVQLRQIVEALLFLGGADADAAVPDVEPLELNRWTAEHLAGPLPTNCANEIVHDAALGEPLWIKVHSGLLAQLIDNLLDNACKYSRPGSTVRVRSWREGDLAVLAVEDTGQGISEEDLPRVFEPFFRSKAVRRQGIAGLGLGLSVVERIVHVFGGSVTVQSELDAGSRFEIRLPLAGATGPFSPLSGPSPPEHRIRETTL